MPDILAEYAPVLLKVCEDIYKNLHGKSIVRTANYDLEMEDIRQETTCVLLEIHLRSPHKFPSPRLSIRLRILSLSEYVPRRCQRAGPPVLPRP